MIVVSVSYPNDPSTRFDLDYYMQTHIPLVRERWSAMGLRELRVLRGLGTPDGGAAPVRLMALLTWDNAEALERAVAAHGQEIFGDIARFTDARPVMQVNAPEG
ncbi:EthD family reductase [Roseicella aquatilis]|uniref:EthD family reductase n=1 Tax=Roseicella aquatilis TaxID=2527868 RepID=A0A4R4DXP5_9PROT|nr:EthD family reductase [Roseicella aquatilis]TCZ66579.1 EthD family reductase [Roseicella aquatilis]